MTVNPVPTFAEINEQNIAAALAPSVFGIGQVLLVRQDQEEAADSVTHTLAVWGMTGFHFSGRECPLAVYLRVAFSAVSELDIYVDAHHVSWRISDTTGLEFADLPWWANAFTGRFDGGHYPYLERD